MKKYNHYKDSKIDWIGEIPEHWECKRLGTWFKERKNKVSSDDFEPLSVTKNGVVPQLENAAKSKDTENRKLVRKGDFVINSRSDRKGSSGLSSLDGSVSLINIVIEPKGINGLFSHYLFKSNAFVEEYYRNGRGIVADLWSTRYELMKLINIPFPPLQEQTAIAQFLDEKTGKIDQAIQIKEREIELLKERRQILIQEVVTGKKVWVSTGSTNEVSTGSTTGKWVKPEKTKDSGVECLPAGEAGIGEIPEDWEVRKLKQICEINKKTLPENTTPNFELDYVDIGSVSFENGIEKTEKYLFKNAPSRARRIANRGNTIISTVRTYLKAIDFIDQEKEKFIYSTGFAVLKPNKEIYPEYLFTFVRSNAFTEQVKVNSTGMSYPAINSTTLGNQRVLFMSIEQQKQIVSYLENLESKIAQSITLKEQEIKKLKEYKTVLIDSAVTGKIKVEPVEKVVG